MSVDFLESLRREVKNNDFANFKLFSIDDDQLYKLIIYGVISLYILYYSLLRASHIGRVLVGEYHVGISDKTVHSLYSSLHPYYRSHDLVFLGFFLPGI
jgi:hypothetical protein